MWSTITGRHVAQPLDRAQQPSHGSLDNANPVPHLRQALLQRLAMALRRRGALLCSRYQQPRLAEPRLQVTNGGRVRALLRVRRLRGRDGLRSWRLVTVVGHAVSEHWADRVYHKPRRPSSCKRCCVAS